MNNKLLFIILAGILLLVTKTGTAGVEGENFLGIQYGISYYEDDAISQDYKPEVALARFGYYFTPNFSVEGRYGFGVQDDTRFLPEFGSGLDATLDIDYIYGIYGSGHLNLAESFSLYGILGVSKVRGKASIPSIPGLVSSENNSSISYGAGVDLRIIDQVDLNLEYMMYLDKSEFDLGVIALGVVFNF